MNRRITEIEERDVMIVSGATLATISVIGARMGKKNRSLLGVLKASAVGWIIGKAVEITYDYLHKDPGLFNATLNQIFANTT